MPAKKKKKGRAPKATVSNPETEEELLALAAIYGDEFFKHHDGLGFDLIVVPHPGLLDENLVHVQLSVRYPYHYPAQPVALKLKNPEGLSADECRSLMARLTESAGDHAELEEVCAFNLVDMCQEVLRAANERRQQGLVQEQQQRAEGGQRCAAATAMAAGDQAHGQSLWHSMQRRNGGLGLEEQRQQQPKLSALELQGSMRGSLAGADLSILSLGDDLASMGQVGGLSGGLWGYDDGLYDMDDSVDIDAGLFEPSSPPTLQTPLPPTLQAPSATAAGATTGAASPTAPSPELLGVEGEALAVSPQPAPAEGAKTAIVAGASPQAGAQPLAAIGGPMAPGSSLINAAVPVAEPADRERVAKPAAVPSPKDRAGSAARPSPFERQSQTHVNRVPSSVLARRLPRAMRALVIGGSSASFDERPRRRLRASRASGAGKVPAAAPRTHGRQRSDTEASNGSSDRSGSGSSSGSSSGDGADQTNGNRADAKAAAVDTARKWVPPGRLWARGGDSSSGTSSSGSSGEEEGEDETGSESSSSSSSGSSGGGGRSRRQRRSGGARGGSFQREASTDVKLPLLIGHLLTLAAAGPNLDARGRGLEALCDHLRRQGLLPQWLHWLVTRQPQLFDRAFNRVFDADIHAAAVAVAGRGGGPAVHSDSRALTRFWSRQGVATTLGQSDAGASQQQQPLGARSKQQLPGARGWTGSGGSSMAALAASRYLSDFQELRKLGKGGFGVVVAAVNRLDGRQYAVKKIKLDSGSPSSYTRITREVATLSRLQHPNVVRYFQAWCENLLAGVGLDGSEDEDEEDGFGDYFEDEDPEQEEVQGTDDGGEEDGGDGFWGFGYSHSSLESQPPGQSHNRTQTQQQQRGAAPGFPKVAAAPRLGAPGGHQASQPHHRHALGSQHEHHNQHQHQHQLESAPTCGLAPVREEAAELASTFSSNVDDPETGSEVSTSTATTAAASSGAASGAATTAAGSGSGAAQRAGSGGTTGTTTCTAHVEPASDNDGFAVPVAGSRMWNRRPGATRLGGSGGGGDRGGAATAACGRVGRYDQSSETNTTPTTTTTTTTATAATTTTATTTTGGRGQATRLESGDRRRRPRGYRRKASLASTSSYPTQMLYIQMEFCTRTLADVLQEGPLQEEDAWRVLRGILAGLAYIHSQGVIHRDLKPANIFYGANGEIKLGDFGLAKIHSSTSAEDAAASAGAANPSGAGGALGGTAAAPGLGAAAVGPTASGAGHSWRATGGADGTAPSERTGVCGSFFYISPEIKNGWARYDEKVDLWSLGVVVFELWHPFATGMERAVLLNDLRDHARLPEAWERAHPRVARLIRWLMAPNPAERPSAREVLASDLLPPRVEDEQLKDLLRYLPSNPDATERVVAALFSLTEAQPPGTFTGATTPAGGGPAGPHWPPGAGGGPARAPGSSSNLEVSYGLAPLPFDGSELPGAPRVQHTQAREDIIRVVRSVFECHGARSFYSNQVGYVYPGLAPDAVRLLSSHGSLLAMRHEMRYPFAVWMVQQLAMEQAAVYPKTGALDTLRRYDISYVMRSGRARSLPTAYCQADLDLLHAAGGSSGSSGHPDKGRLLVEAEAIKTVTQVMDHFLPELGRYEVRISHRAIERALYDSMGLSPAAAAAAGGPGSSGAGATREAEVAVRRLVATALRSSPMLGAVPAELRYKAWPAVKAGLDGIGLPADRVAHCKRCVCELPGDVQGALTRLKAYLQEAAASTSVAATGTGSQAMSTAPAAADVWKGTAVPTAAAAKAAAAAASGASPLSLPRGAAGHSSGSSGGAVVHPHTSPLPAALAVAMKEVETVVELLEVWGLPANQCSQVVLDPLMSPAAEYYSGVFFQVHLLGLPAAPGQQSAGAGAASLGSTQLGLLHAALRPRPTAAGMVAVGGRYDALLRALWATSIAATSPAPGQHPHAHGSLAGYSYTSLPGAVGATLNVERLITGLSQQRAATGAPALGSAGLLQSLEASKADVLVCARGGDGTLEKRMALVLALWNAGVRAEIMPRPAPSLGDQYAYAQARGARAVVILGDRDAASGYVTIKSLDKRSEKSLDKRSESYLVSVQDAPRYLAAALAGGSSAGRGVAGAVCTSVGHSLYASSGGKDAAISAPFPTGGVQRQGAILGWVIPAGGGVGGPHGGGRLDAQGGNGGAGGSGRDRDRDRERERERNGGRGGEEGGGGYGAGRRGGMASETDRERDRDRDRDHEPWDRECGGDRQGGGERERRCGSERHYHWGDREPRGRRGKGGG